MMTDESTTEIYERLESRFAPISQLAEENGLNPFQSGSEFQWAHRKNLMMGGIKFSRNSGGHLCGRGYSPLVKEKYLI